MGGIFVGCCGFFSIPNFVQEKFGRIIKLLQYVKSKVPRLLSGPLMVLPCYFNKLRKIFLLYMNINTVNEHRLFMFDAINESKKKSSDSSRE